MWLILHFVVYFILTNAAQCIQLPFKVSPSSKPSLGNVLVASSSSYGFENLENNVYVGEISVAGQNFTVQFDTGSSDLWIDPSAAGVFSLPGAVDTGVQSAICYLDTTCAQGPVLIGSVSVGDFTVNDQAFIDASGSNATFLGVSGLIGFGSTVTVASSIEVDLEGAGNVNSRPFLENALDTYTNTSNFISFLLSRSELGDADGGTFTIGELASGLEDVQQSPQLPVLLDTRWATAINGMIINGVPMIARSSTGSPNLAAGQLLANIDTGTARAAAPPDFVDAMYQNMPGAQFDGVSEYTLPCNDMVTVDIVIGNQTYPIHPIDLVVIADDGENPRTDSSNFYCVGAFSYLEPGSTDIDVILGDTFLRNVYTLYNFGNWTRQSEGPPFIQLLSTTNASEAEAEYASLNNARLAAKAGGKSKVPLSPSGGIRTPNHLRTMLSMTTFCILIYLL